MEDIQWPGLVRKVAGREMEARYTSDLYFLLIYQTIMLGDK